MYVTLCNGHIRDLRVRRRRLTHTSQYCTEYTVLRSTQRSQSAARRARLYTVRIAIVYGIENTPTLRPARVGRYSLVVSHSFRLFARTSSHIVGHDILDDIHLPSSHRHDRPDRVLKIESCTQ